MNNYDKIKGISRGIVSVNAPDRFNLDKYITKDVHRDKADAWGAGDYKKIIKKNMEGYINDNMGTR